MISYNHLFKCLIFKEYVVETVSDFVEPGENEIKRNEDQEGASEDLVLNCPSPYSDISDR